MDSTVVPPISGRELTTPLTFCHAQAVKEFPVRGLRKAGDTYIRRQIPD